MKREIIFFLLYVPNLYVITSYERTFLVCLITTFCPCMKSRGFFLFKVLFGSAYLWLVGEIEAAVLWHVSQAFLRPASGLLWKPAGHVHCLSGPVQANWIQTNQWISASTRRSGSWSKNMVTLSQQFLITCNSSDW